jgi:hypothetical protein
MPLARRYFAPSFPRSAELSVGSRVQLSMERSGILQCRPGTSPRNPVARLTHAAMSPPRAAGHVCVTWITLIRPAASSACACAKIGVCDLFHVLAAVCGLASRAPRTRERSGRCVADRGSSFVSEASWVAGLRRTATQVLCAAPRPGHDCGMPRQHCRTPAVAAKPRSSKFRCAAAGGQ